jgi:antitoxin component YwqK of YwqJK toxin-antitoxin module
MAKEPRKKRMDYHRDGSIRAKGATRGGELDGYWEWFRKDGIIMRSGHFEMGKRTGEWTTYDAAGKVYKVTRL